ncbi:MAG: chromate efflux transporter [Bacteroidetes bacterium]|nr:chromate efflux transporter [Bacteroidota bacterium]
MYSDKKNKLKEVATLFLRLGCISFGGPAVHIAMMEKEVVQKRKWMTNDHFLDLIGATNLIPGPNSTEMTMHCGHERAGWKGLIVAGMCFIVPAVIITGLIAWAYQNYGTLPQVAPFIFGIKPAIISVVVALMISLARKALKSVELWLIGFFAAVLSLCGINEMYVLFGSGFIGILWHFLKNQKHKANIFIPLFSINTTSNLKLFWLFLKIGSILYGSGYVLFAFLDEELVKTGLITKQTLIDAIAVGQFTPGPVFSSATFIGWQIAGITGAMVATLGIFLPSFLFVAFLNPLIPKLRESKIMSVFLDTVNAASIAIILSVCVEMFKTSVTDWKSFAIMFVSFLISFFIKKINSAFIVIGGALLGYILYLI